MGREVGDPFGPRREAGTNARARGTNPRAKRTNPRAHGTNPSAGTSSDRARVERLTRRAVARYRVATGDPWCSTCDDTAWLDTAAGYVPCPDHRRMTSRQADEILHPGWTV